LLQRIDAEGLGDRERGLGAVAIPVEGRAAAA
jgi:hypothetical protein